MIAPTDLPAEWPPLDGDAWADHNGTEWVVCTTEVNDEVRRSLISIGGKRQITPGYLLETASPLRLVAKGWERLRGERALAEMSQS